MLLFGFDAEGLQRQLIDRVGQTVLTCPTTACFDGLPDAPERVVVGGQLRHFGDKFQSSKMIDGQRYWRIPVMEGEFLVQESFGIQKAIGGGNLLILAEHQTAALAAAEAAVAAMRRAGRDHAVSRRHRARRQQGRREEIQEHDRVHQRRVLPDAARTGGVETQLPASVNSVLEIVVDGLDRSAIEQALRAGLAAACRPGVVEITAGNYGGKLGKHHFHLHQLLS